MSGAPTWRIDHVHGPAAELHAESAELVATASRIEVSLVGLERTVRVLEPEAPALVLGSTQPEADIDRGAAAAAGVTVARRRSGGGAVLVGPDEVLWIDVILPAADPLWDGDVGRAGWWLGDSWARAIAEVTDQAPTVWRGALVRSRWSSRVCFAGLGPGEVVIGGAKVVGVSQRRTRRGVLFQTAALLRWRPVELMDLFDLDPGERSDAVADLRGVAAGLGASTRTELLGAVVEQIRQAG